MSRIGASPISIPKEATVERSSNFLVVKGPKGQLELSIPGDITISQEGDVLNIGRNGDSKKVKALHGFIRAQINNMLSGVTTGWSKTLELSGVGYRAAMSGTNVVLSIGFSHPVTIIPPQGTSFALVEGKIVISGVDKQSVGQISAIIRDVKPPEPYKGKGIKYQGEIIRKKAGKAVKAAGAAAK